MLGKTFEECYKMPNEHSDPVMLKVRGRIWNKLAKIKGNFGIVYLGFYILIYIQKNEDKILKLKMHINTLILRSIPINFICNLVPEIYIVSLHKISLKNGHENKLLITSFPIMISDP